MYEFLYKWLFEKLADARAVVEFGAGRFDKLRFVPATARKVGIEAFGQHVDHPDYEDCVRICGDMRRFEDLVEPADMDVALFVDSLEHLSREDAFDLIRRVQGKFRKIALMIPEGNHPQSGDEHGFDNDYYQTHRSTWREKDVAEMGFQEVILIPDFHAEPGKDRGCLFATWTRDAQ